MLYIMLLLEGIITFISPCILPLLPLYISYFAGGEGGSKGRALKNSAGFTLGFSAVFTAMGAFAGSVGHLLRRHEVLIGIATGGMIILFGLSFLGVVKLGIGRKKQSGIDLHNLGFFSSILFGMVFAVSFTPCIGAYLTVALSIAANQATAAGGAMLLLCFSLGLGLPFMICALLLDQLKSAFAWIKRHYGVINKIAGAVMILFGILMMTGLFGRFIALMPF